MTVAYFLTVRWCESGRRGIFVRKDGSGFCKTEPHTPNEMGQILGPFELILSPKSESFTEGEITKFTNFYPLAEYMGQFGIARIPENEAGE